MRVSPDWVCSSLRGETSFDLVLTPVHLGSDFLCVTFFPYHRIHVRNLIQFSLLQPLHANWGFKVHELKTKHAIRPQNHNIQHNIFLEATVLYFSSGILLIWI